MKGLGRYNKGQNLAPQYTITWKKKLAQTLSTPAHNINISKPHITQRKSWWTNKNRNSQWQVFTLIKADEAMFVMVTEQKFLKISKCFTVLVKL